jgi:hypothetical protein
MLKKLVLAMLVLQAVLPARAEELHYAFPTYKPSPQEIESSRLAKEMEKVQPETDRTVQSWLEAVLATQVQPAPPVKASPAPASPKEEKCRMVPDNRGLFTLATGYSPNEALSAAKARIPPQCSGAGKTVCERYADMKWGSNSEFLPAFKKHMRDPKWKYSCSAPYTCSHHQKRVCEGGAPKGTGAASRQ